jgi:hypothetical protein
MRHIVAILLFFALTQGAFAREFAGEPLPMPIDTFIKNHYPEATELEWSKDYKEGDSTALYNIHLYNNDLLVTLEMTAQGKMLARETEIAIKDVPKTFIPFIQNHKIKFVAYVEYHDDKPVYVMESIYKGHSHFNIFSANGKLLHTQKKFALF